MSAVEAQTTVVGRLLSVNVGLPREVDWHGTTVRTAIWKEPVEGPRMVRRINIDGDDQADRVGHGGEHRAVFVYQIDSYRYWGRELDRDDFVYGQFGENFTVEGLPDDEVCIGDRYRIGSAEFEVTQPRVTCFRVGVRMEDARMPSLLVSHHRPGFYLRVLNEGLVEAGDEIVRIAVGPEQLTVADVDGLLYLPNRSARMLSRAVRVPALSAGWRDSFQALLDQSDRRARPKPAWAGFRPLTVTEVVRETANIVSVRLAAADGSALPVAVPGQYLSLRLRPNGLAGAGVIRSFSLSDAGADGNYRISVKREPGGIASAYIHARLSVGEVIDVAAPRGTFVLEESRRPVVLLSAGVGVTPVLAMLHWLAASHDERRIWWIQGARNGSEHPFKREVGQLVSQLPHAKQVIAYSRPEPGDAPDATGRVTFELVQQTAIPDDADYFICGPAAFMRELSAALTAHGLAPERIHTELFQPADPITPGRSASRAAPHPPRGPAGSGAAVTFARSNLTVPWDPAYANLLELAEACDVPASYSCRQGVCHYCETSLLSGQVSYATEPLERPADDRVLLCCAQPAEEITVEL